MNARVAAVALLSALCACVALLAAPPARAQDYPARPIRLVVPWPPGGGVDIAARTLQSRLGEHLGQPIVVDNRPGASGVIGATLVARAPADGHTLLLASAGPNAILPLLNAKTPYRALEDFAEVSHFANTVYVVVVHPSLAAASLKELIAMAKTRPGKLTVGVTGTASPAHITAEFLRASSGIELVSVFYKGVANAIVEVIGGQISMAVVTISPILPHARTGKLRVLGVTSARRSAQLPDVPTLAESGYPGFEVVNWYGVLAPAGTPRRVVQRIAEAMAQTLKAPDVRERLTAAGLEIVESTPAQYTTYRKADLALWAKMIKEGNIRAE